MIAKGYGKREKYAIQTMCQFFGVSRSGSYDYIRRMDKPARDEALATEIARCQEHSRKTYGCRRYSYSLNGRESDATLQPYCVSCESTVCSRKSAAGKIPGYETAASPL